MSGKRIGAGVAGLVLAVACAGDAAAQVLAQRPCRTVWQGQEVRGVMRIEWLPYSGVYRISGQFHDPARNLIEFEVDTNQPGGVGGMWFNNARHREARIHLQMLNDRTFDVSGEAGTARYFCQ